MCVRVLKSLVNAASTTKTPITQQLVIGPGRGRPKALLSVIVVEAGAQAAEEEKKSPAGKKEELSLIRPSIIALHRFGLGRSVAMPRRVCRRSGRSN